MRVAVVLCCSWVGPVDAAELPRQITFQNVVENKDVPLGEGASFLQDREGFMWLGGSNALLRYDGNEFKQVDISLSAAPNDKVPVKFTEQLFQDSQGTIWVGSRAGLLKYDPHTEILTQVADAPSQPMQISKSRIFRFGELPSGEIIGCGMEAIYIIDPTTNQYRLLVPNAKDPSGLKGPRTSALFIENANTIWFATNAGLEKLDWATKTFSFYPVNSDHPDSPADGRVTDMVADADGKFWLATAHGLVHYDPATRQGKRYLNDPNDKFSLGNNDIWKLMKDSQGVLWIGTDGGGVSLFDAQTGHFVTHIFEPGRIGSLSTNVVRTLFEDKTGDIWVGNYPSGVNFWDRSSAVIQTYANDPTNPNSLSANRVTSVTEDQIGNLWIGTGGGGGVNFFNRTTGQFTRFKSDPKDPKTLSGNSIHEIYVDPQGIVWIATHEGGVSTFDPTTQQFTRLPFASARIAAQRVSTSTQLNDPAVWSIKEDSQHNLWMATNNSGLSKYNRETKEFTHYVHLANDPESISYNVVMTTLEDSRGNFWVCTWNGLNLMDREKGTFKAFHADPKNPRAISDDLTASIFEDSQKRLWIGTRSGLNLFDPVTQTFTVYNQKSGFANEFIRKIVEDKQGLIWVSTNNGFSSFNPATQAIKNYVRLNGRLIGAFAYRSGMVSRQGEIIFGGTNGLRIINTQALAQNALPPQVALTDFKLMTGRVQPGGADGILNNAINRTNTITLEHTQPLFAVDFTAPNFRNPSDNQYAYRLDGFDHDWVMAGNEHSAKYTNLNPGTYVFRVRASNNDGVWSDESKAITLILLPAPWKTWWAYSAYCLGFLLALAAFVRSQRKKVAYERQVNTRLRNLDSLKEQFLANTSHELRTPIYGIIGLAESLAAEFSSLTATEARARAKMITTSGKRLAHLVGNMLEFSQLTSNTLTLNCSWVPLQSLLQNLLLELQDAITAKSLSVQCELADNILIYGDPQKLTKIFHDLFDNAIKFTEKGGITVEYAQHDKLDIITLQDTGVGIAPENIEGVFGVFQQVDGSASRAGEGAGLGLSVTKRLIEVHNGDIKIASVLGQGTRVSVHLPHVPQPINDNTLPRPAAGVYGPGAEALPLTKDTEAASAPVDAAAKLQQVYVNGHLYAHESAVPMLATLDGDYTILIVDDEPVNRILLKARLGKHNLISLEAADGDKAVQLVDQMISSRQPLDLVVMDVMMPRMTGYEACERIRQHCALHQLPIIFLTANHQPAEVLKGFLAGGNDFLTKPVTEEVLIDRIKIHLSLLEESRRLAQDKSASMDAPANEAAEPAQLNCLQVQLAVANILQSLAGLISGVTLMGCWLRDAHNQFICVDNPAGLPPIASHPPFTLADFEAPTTDSQNIALVRRVLGSAKQGRLGKTFEGQKCLFAELILTNGQVAGFTLLAGAVPDFLNTSDKALLRQSLAHMAEAIAKHTQLNPTTSVGLLKLRRA